MAISFTVDLIFLLDIPTGTEGSYAFSCADRVVVVGAIIWIGFYVVLYGAFEKEATDIRV